MSLVLVKLWMTSPVITVGPNATLGEAALEMSRRRIRRLIVVDPTDKRGRLLGIISLHDVARAFPPDLNPLSAAAGDGPRVPIHEVMSHSPATVDPMDALTDAARLMNDEKIGAVPVTVRGIPVGILTESDIFRAMIEMSGIRREGTTILLELGADEQAMDVVRAADRAGLRLESFYTMRVHGKRTVTLRTRGLAAAAAVDMLRSGRVVLEVEPPVGEVPA